MSVRHLELADFRIFRAVHLDLEATGTTVITGSNGSGKTSVLEALAYLGTRRSFRGAPPEAMVRTGAESAIVRAEIDNHDSPTLVEAQVLPAGRSRIRVNRKAVNTRKDLGAAAPCTIFSPEDLVIVSGARRDGAMSSTTRWPSSTPRAPGPPTRRSGSSASAPRCCASRAAGAPRR